MSDCGLTKRDGEEEEDEIYAPSVVSIGKIHEFFLYHSYSEMLDSTMGHTEDVNEAHLKASKETRFLGPV